MTIMMIPRGRIAQRYYISISSYTVISLEAFLLHIQYFLIFFFGIIFALCSVNIFYKLTLVLSHPHFLVINHFGFYASTHSTFKHVFYLIFFIKTKYSNHCIFKLLLKSQQVLSI